MASHEETIKRVDQLISQGEPLAALALLKNELQKERNPRLIFKLALLQIKMGLYSDAYSLLKELTKEEPWNLDALYNLGLASTKLGKLEEAIAYYRTYLRRREDPEGYNNLGIALDRLGRLDEALEAYTKAIELDKKFPQPLINRGNLLAHLGRYDEALRDLREALKLTPDNFLVNYSIGIVHFLKKEYDLATYYLREAINLNPYYSDAYYTLGDINYILGNYREALGYYQRALEFNEGDSLALRKALEVSYKGQLWEDIITITDRLLKGETTEGLKTTHKLTPYLESMVKLYKAIALLKLSERSPKGGEEREKGLKLLEELISSSLVNTEFKVEALKRRAELFEKWGLLSDAKNDLELASKLAPLDPEVLISSARVLRKTGDYERAYMQALKALRARPELSDSITPLLKELEARIGEEKNLEGDR